MFEKAVQLVLGEEGVLSDDADDNGGLTKYGISKKSYPNLDIRNLTKDQAIEIYRKDFWQMASCDKMPWWAALLTFDAVVQHGPIGKKFLQDAVGVTQDGAIGPKTLQAVSSIDPAEGVAKLQYARLNRIYLGHEDWSKYKKGWMLRMFRMSHAAAIP